MPRYNITMPEELWDRIGDSAPAGNRSYFIRGALEAALDGRSSPGKDGGLMGVPQPSSPPAPPRASARHCERCGTLISSPSLRSHPNCGGKVLPPPS